MRGNPLKEFIIFIIIWGSLIMPISILSKERPFKDDNKNQINDMSYECLVTVKTTSLPTLLRLSQDNKVCWEVKNSQEYVLEKELSLKHQKGVAELLLEADFNNAETKAIAVTISPISSDDQTITLWGEENFNELLHFSWELQND